MENNVRQLRKAAGMTQAALAASANTSQQQIQRIESGAQTVRLDVAQSIAIALKSPLLKVFPPVSPPPIDDLEEFPEIESMVADSIREMNRRRFEDTDVVFRIMVALRGEHQLEFPVTKVDSERFERFLLLDDAQQQFIFIPSYLHNIAINRNHIMRAHVFFDRVPSSYEVETLSTSRSETINLDEDFLMVFMPAEAEPASIQVEPDDGDLDSDLPSDLAQLFFNLELGYFDSDFFGVIDVDGESSFFSIEDVAAVALHHKFFGGKYDVWTDDLEQD